MRTLLAAALMLGCSIGAANAAQKDVQTERVVALQPGGILQLESSGKAVLANLLLPDSARSDDWLAAHTLQQPITFAPAGEDRYGRLRIESDIARAMLRDGVAIIYASEGTIPDAWRAAEREARQRGGGVWSTPGRELNPENAAQHIGRFALVKGTITRVYEGKTFTAINFGDNWREDFSVTIPAKLRRSMKPQLAALKPGVTLEVRGVLHDENGPMVTLAHPANLEVR